MPVGAAKLLLIAAALFCHAAHAQTPPDAAQQALAPAAASPPLTPAQVDDLVAKLESDDATARVHAGTTLGSGVASLADLERALLRDDLTAEQRHRLMAAAYACFGQEPRGAMGVSFGSAPDRPGVYIGRTEPAFDANTKLRPGDRIETIDGVRLEDGDHGIAVIQSHTPGDELALGIERNGQLLDVTLVLGSRSTLKDASPLKERAWLIRSARYAGRLRGSENVIDSGLPPRAWRVDGGGQDGPALPRGYEPLRVVAGGEARAFDRAVAGLQDRPVRRITTNRLMPNQVPVNPVADQDRLRLLRMMRMGERAKEQNFEQRLENPNLDERQRHGLEEGLGRCRLSIQTLDEQIRFLEAALRPR